jgi:hypothetical protein
MTAAFILTKTGRDALYFQKDGLFDLPWAYLGIALLAVPVALTTLATARTLGPRRARIVAPLVMVVLQVIFHSQAEPGGGSLMTLFFMLVPLIYGVLFSTVWLFGAELLERLPRENLPRSYATLGGASMSGGLLGAFIAKLLASHLEPRHFLLLGAVGLLGSTAVVLAGQLRYPAAAPARGPSIQSPQKPHSLMPAFGEVFGTLKAPYVRSLAFIAVAAAVISVLIEFQFYALVATSGGGNRENTNFFANFYLVLTGAGLLLQLLVMPALQRRVGVNGSLMVLPLALFSGALTLAVSASGLARSALRVAEGGLKSSIHRANWEQAYLPLRPSHRVTAKVLVDGMAARMAEGVAAGLLLVWLNFFVAGRDLVGLDVSWIGYFIAGSAILWAGFAYVMGRDLTVERCQEICDGQLSPEAALPDSCSVTMCLGRDLQRKTMAT